MPTYGPYSLVRKASNLIFVSGQVGVNPNTKTAGISVAEQTKQALRNLRSVLRTEGARMDDVIKTTVFLVSMDDFAVMNELYEQAFSAPRPARSTIGISELPRVANEVPILVEIEAIAYREAV